MPEPHDVPIDFTRLFDALPGRHLELLPDAARFRVAAVSDGLLLATGTSREQWLHRSPAEALAAAGLPGPETDDRWLADLAAHGVAPPLSVPAAGARTGMPGLLLGRRVGSGSAPSCSRSKYGPATTEPKA